MRNYLNNKKVRKNLTFSNMVIEEIIKNESDTRLFIEKHVLPILKKQTILLLNGTLGSGKTFFTNILVNLILESENRPQENVTSPTFNIVKIYNTKNFDIYHFDLYRIKNVEELYELDINDAFENISIIEWSEIIESILPYKPIRLNIKIKNEQRVYKLEY